MLLLSKPTPECAECDAPAKIQALFTCEVYCGRYRFNGRSTEVRPVGTPSKCGGSACRSISAHGAAASLASSAITTSVLAFAANNVAANTKLPGSARNSFADLS